MAFGRDFHGPGDTRFDSRGFDRYGFGRGIGGSRQPGRYEHGFGRVYGGRAGAGRYDYGRGGIDRGGFSRRRGR
jgi:hypothetical protein